MNPDPQDLLRLADEVAKATGPDDKLAALVWRALSGAQKSDHWYTDFRGVYVTDHTAPNALASVDDALLTVPEGHWAEGSLGTHVDKRSAIEIHAPCTFDAVGQAWAATPELAVTAAALRAHSTKETSNG